jgi:hypothetical protein
MAFRISWYGDRKARLVLKFSLSLAILFICTFRSLIHSSRAAPRESAQTLLLLEPQRDAQLLHPFDVVDPAAT